MKAPFLTLMVSCFLSHTVLAAAPAVAEKGEKAPDVAALVNGKPILRSDLLQQIAEGKKRGGKEIANVPEAKLYEMFREEMIRMELLRAESQKGNFESNEEFKKRLADAREGIMMRFFLKGLQDKWNAALTPEVLEKAAKNLKEYVLVLERMIVPNEKVATGVKKLAEGGQSFASLAAKHAIDKTQAVTMDPVPEAILPADARGMFSKMKPGEIVVVPDRGSVALIKFVARKPLTDQKILEQLARQKLLSEQSEKFIRDLEKNSKIERFDLEGNPASSPEPEPEPVPAGKK